MSEQDCGCFKIPRPYHNIDPEYVKMFGGISEDLLGKSEAMNELTKQTQNLGLGYSILIPDCGDWFTDPTHGTLDDLFKAIPEEYWTQKFKPIFNAWSYHLEAGLTQEQRKQFMQEIIDAL